LKNLVIRMVPRSLARLLTGTCRLGYFIVADLSVG
jgi:hypothetical protein